jgi:hypothetical protein
MTVRRFMSVAVATAVLAVAAVGCGDDDDESSGGNVERYCELVEELDQAGTEAFAALEADESATDEDYAAMESQFLEEHADDFDELREVAPDEIADDVDVILTAQEERAAGGEQEEPSEAASAAEERIGEFEDANCDSAD